MSEILLTSDLTLSYTGVDLSAGPLPALFYFSLSAHDSLFVDPYNQPVAYLSALPLRIFSITLPAHENNFPPTEALGVWAKKMREGERLLESFIDNALTAIDLLIERGIVLKEKIGVAGLSRGAFIATHIAARHSSIRWILGFAPLTKLSFVKESASLTDDPAVNALNLTHCVPSLIDRSLRFYIGNCDTRVSTRHCFDFIESLSLCATHKRIRSPQADLIIYPSIGNQGHGTPKPIFHAGAQWLAEKMEVIDAL